MKLKKKCLGLVSEPDGQSDNNNNNNNNNGNNLIH